MLQKARKLIDPRPLLAAVILVAAGAGVYLYEEREGVLGSLGDLELSFLVAEDDVLSLKETADASRRELVQRQAELALKQEEVDLREQEAVSQNFPSAETARGLGASVVTFAADNDLGIGQFVTAQTTSTLSARDYSAISYSLVASGTPSSLIGVLDTLGSFTTLRITKLEFTRHAEDEGRWDMILNLVVLYVDAT